MADSQHPKDRQFVDALARGLSLLEALSRAQKPLGNRDLAKATGLAPATVSRLTHTLSVLGYVRLSHSSRAYELTPKNLTLGYPVLAGLSLIDRVRPLLKVLADRTGETAAIAIRDGLHITFVDVVVGSSIVAVRLATGGRLPMAVSAAGLAIMGAMEESERRTLASRVRSDITRRGGDVAAFNARLSAACQEGVAIVRDAWRPGIGGIAMSARTNGELVAVTIPVATGAVSEQAVRGPLLQALHDVVGPLGG